MVQATPDRPPTPRQVFAADLAPNISDTERQMALASMERSYRTRRNFPCPNCGGYGKCIVYDGNPALDYVYCSSSRVGAHGNLGDGQLVPRYGIMPTYLYRVSKDGKAKTAPTRYIRRDTPLSSSEVIDRILRRLPTVFPLTLADKDLLAARGYNAADPRWAFASLPAEKNERMRATLVMLHSGAAQNEDDLLGTFGFSRDRRFDNGVINFMGHVEGAGLIEFIVDQDGVYTGFQIAPHAPRVDDKGKAIKRESPVRMSTTGRYHVARPLRDDCRHIVYVESVHKANLSCDALSAPTVGTLGAGNYRNVVPAAQALDPDRKRWHVVAFDKDQWGERLEKAAINDLLRAGYTNIALARWDPAYSGPDDALAHGASISIEPYQNPKGGKQDVQRIYHAYSWQRSSETAEDRKRRLDEESRTILTTVWEHLRTRSSDHGVLAIASAPSLGKTTMVSQIGMPGWMDRLVDIAWIGQRHAMGREGALANYHHIMPCDESNCSHPALHSILASKGYNTSILHRNHPTGPCAYIQQFDKRGSTFFQTGHVQTSYPSSHGGGLIVDELSITEWLPEDGYSIAHLRATAAKFVVDSIPDIFLRALESVITDAHTTAQQNRTQHLPHEPLHGKALFDLLDTKCEGRLEWLIVQLKLVADARDDRPWPSDLDPDDENVLETAENLPHVVLPVLYHAFLGELLQWKSGNAWNSRMRLGPTKTGEWGIKITKRLQFGLGKDAVLPPLVVLDGTADPEIYGRLFNDVPVNVARADVPPPPHTKHIAVRTGKRYGKVSMTQDKNEASRIRSIERAAKEIKRLLDDIDPDGIRLANGDVALITHMGCEQELAKRVGIRYVSPADPDYVQHGRTGHFWGIRGSNQFEQVPILIVCGTPALDPDEIHRLTRGLYSSTSDAPIEEGCTNVDDVWRYNDPRAQHVADWLSHAELTQCAHRSRPLRNDGRIVLTLCMGDVDFLPTTCEITFIPRLDTDGELQAAVRDAKNDRRFREAITALRDSGAAVNVHTIAAQARASVRDVSPWWNVHKDHFNLLQTGYQLRNKYTYCTSGNQLAIDITHEHVPPLSSLSSVSVADNQSTSPSDDPLTLDLEPTPSPTVLPGFAGITGVDVAGAPHTSNVPPADYHNPYATNIRSIIGA
jgi:hypothetical protein